MTIAAEVLFLAGYAAALVLVAAGLDALGRRATDPWASPALAGSRPPDAGAPADSGAGPVTAAWPEHDVSTFHTGLAAVALAAALVLTTVAAVRHHGPADVAVELAVAAVIGVRAVGLVTRWAVLRSR